MIQSGKNVRFCPDPKLITEPKTFHIQVNREDRAFSPDAVRPAADPAFYPKIISQFLEHLPHSGDFGKNRLLLRGRKRIALRIKQRPLLPPFGPFFKFAEGLV